MESLNDHIQSWAAALGPTGEAILRLILAALAGGLIGLEREVRGRQAGFRTNTLVCLGSCLVMLVSVQFGLHAWPTHPPGSGININVDPARIAYGVMTGIGFLGAGTIIKHRTGVLGLTTAAGMWCVAAVGLAVGFGMYTVAAAGALGLLLVLWVLEYVQRALPRLRYRTVTVRRRWEPNCVTETVQRLKQAELKVVDVSFRRTADLSHVDIDLHIVYSDEQRYFKFERELQRDSAYDLMSMCET
ncbi:MAG TPA: MgtC/SapB family protein [Tepidisphaeraceae bacterium]|nr:MgtC/SapB family protein [Tepidisphaeraceae bacterium]